MTHFYNYDTRGASAASQIITLERMLSAREDDIHRLHEENQRLKSAGIYAWAVLSKIDSENAQIAADTLDAAIWPTKKRINDV